MIQSVIDSHTTTVICLANSVMRGTINNPLDMKARKAMIREHFPKIEVVYVNDNPFDDVSWSGHLDLTISAFRTYGMENTDITIFGGKESVVDKYKGVFNTKAFDASSFVSSKELVRQSIENFPPSEAWRAGAIASLTNRFPTAYQCVDAIVINSEGKFLLARKPGKVKFCIIGGFSDPLSLSLEEDALREVQEEANVIAANPRYLGSSLVNDKRYALEVDKIKTALFVCDYVSGRPEGRDDVAEVKWFSLADLVNLGNIADYHHDLIKMFVTKHLKLDTFKS